MPQRKQHIQRLSISDRLKHSLEAILFCLSDVDSDDEEIEANARAGEALYAELKAMLGMQVKRGAFLSYGGWDLKALNKAIDMYKEDAGQPAGRSGGGGTSGGGSSNMDAPPVAENAEQPKFSEIKQPGNDTLKWSDLPETMRYYTTHHGRTT